MNKQFPFTEDLEISIINIIYEFLMNHLQKLQQLYLISEKAQRETLLYEKISPKDKELVNQVQCI